MSEDGTGGIDADGVGFVFSVTIGTSAVIGFLVDDPSTWIPLGLLVAILVSAAIGLRR